MFHIAGAGWALSGCTRLHQCRAARRRPGRDSRGDTAARRHQRPSSCRRSSSFCCIHLASRRPTSPALRAIVYGASPITDDVLVKGDGTVRLRIHPGVRDDRNHRRHNAAQARRPRSGRSGRNCCGPAASRYPWVEVRIVDADGEDVPTGAVGELWTRSAQNMAGYWNNPKATAATDHAGRLAENRRRRLPRRRRLHLSVRPGEGHDRLGRRERLPGRGRERPDGAPGRRRRRGHRRTRRNVGRSREGRRRACGRRPPEPKRT